MTADVNDCRVTLLPVANAPADLARVLDGVRAATGRVLNLHRALGHAPTLLDAFAGLALALRHEGTTARTLREFLILRIAQLSESEYELAQHLPMARACGISEVQLQQLASWRQAPQGFSGEVRAALAYAEELYANGVADDTFASLRRHFNEAQIVELTLTASFYVMVALTARAIRLPAELAPHAGPSDASDPG